MSSLKSTLGFNLELLLSFYYLWKAKKHIYRVQHKSLPFFNYITFYYKIVSM